jgi:hypothetical protein
MRRKMMSNIYVNEETGKKIRVYKQIMVHVYDHEDPRDVLDFWNTEEGVAQWCYENADDFDDNFDAIEEAYNKERWSDVIELTNCRHCNYEYEEEWVVEHIEEKE